MQNLIPGVTWGKTMNKKQFDKMYQRMMQREQKKKSVIKKEQELKKDDDLKGCTFRPKTNHKSAKGKKNLGLSVPRLGSQDLDQMENDSGYFGNKSVTKKAKKKDKKIVDMKFLERLEEMKRRDQERKEKTRRKYEEKKRREFEEVHTFQPNKIRRRKGVHSRKASVGVELPEGEVQDKPVTAEGHGRMESGNVMGLSELLGQNGTDPENTNKGVKKLVNLKTAKKSQKGNAFLERIEMYKKQKLEKEKKREMLRIQREQEKIEKECTFQPKKLSKKSKQLLSQKKSRLSAQNIPLTRPLKNPRVSLHQPRRTNQAFSQIVKKYRPKPQTSDSMFQSKDSLSMDNAKSRSRTTKHPSSAIDQKTSKNKGTSDSNFEYQLEGLVSGKKKNKSVRSHLPGTSKTKEAEAKEVLEKQLNGTRSLNLEKEEIKQKNFAEKNVVKNSEEKGNKTDEVDNEMMREEGVELVKGKKDPNQEESTTKVLPQCIDLLNKPSLLKNPAELISNLPNQSSQATEVNVDNIVANTTANVLKMLKENPKMAKELLGMQTPEKDKKRKTKRKSKNYRQDHLVSHNNTKSGFRSKFRKSQITPRMKESYLEKKKNNISHRKTNHGITERIKNNINQRYKINKNLKKSYRKNLTGAEKFKKSYASQFSGKKTKRKKNLKQELELINLENEEIIRMDSEKKEQGEKLVEIFNSELVDKPEQTQTLNLQKIKKLKKIVQKIDHEEGANIQAFESEKIGFESNMDPKLTKTFDLGRPSTKNVYLRIDRLINPKTGRSATPKRTKDFLKRNKEFIRKKNAEIQRKLKAKHASKSQKISKVRKREILTSPIPSHSQVRGKKREEMRKKQREIVASNIEKKFKGGVKWDPKGPKLPEKIHYKKKITIDDKSKLSKSQNNYQRSQTERSHIDEGHPSLKFLLKQFSNRHYGVQVGSLKDEEFGDLEEEVVTPGKHVVEKAERPTKKVDNIQISSGPKKEKNKNNKDQKQKHKVSEKISSKKNKTGSVSKDLTQKKEIDETSLSTEQNKEEEKEAQKSKKEKTNENKNISNSTLSNMEDSQVNKMKPVYKSLNNSIVNSTQKVKRDSKKIKNFSKENTVIKKEFKRKKSPFNYQHESHPKIEVPTPEDLISTPKEQPKKKKLKKKKKGAKQSLIDNYINNLEQQSTKKIENFEVSIRSRKSRKTMDLDSSGFKGKLFKTLEPDCIDFQRLISIEKGSSTRNSSTEVKTVQSFQELSNRDRIKLLLMNGEKMLFDKKTRSQEAKKKKKSKKAKKTQKPKTSKKVKKTKNKETENSKTKKGESKIRKKKVKKTRKSVKDKNKNKSGNEIDLTDDRFNMLSKTLPLEKSQEEPRLCLPGPIKLDNSLVSKKVNKWSRKKKSAKQNSLKLNTPNKVPKKEVVTKHHNNTPINLQKLHPPVHAKDVLPKPHIIINEDAHSPPHEDFNLNQVQNINSSPNTISANPFYDTEITQQASQEISNEPSRMCPEYSNEPGKPSLSSDSVITFEEPPKQKQPQILESELIMSDANLGLNLPVQGLNFAKKDKTPVQEIEISSSQIEIEESEIDLNHPDFIEANAFNKKLTSEGTGVTVEHYGPKESQLESHFDFATNDLEEEKKKMMEKEGVMFSEIGQGADTLHNEK